MTYQKQINTKRQSSSPPTTVLLYKQKRKNTTIISSLELYMYIKSNAMHIESEIQNSN